MVKISPKSEGGAKRILIVDDDPSVREMLVRVMVEAGYSATGAKDGADALLEAGHSAFDLVLLDVGLPGKSGWETRAELARICPNTVVAVITARPHQQAAAQAAGAAALFEKPLDFPQLLRAIEQLLRVSSSQLPHTRR